MKIKSPRKKILFLVIFCISVFFLLPCNMLLSQAPTLETEKCFGGNSWDIPYALKITQDTNYLVFGASQSTDGDVHGNHGERDLWVVILMPDFDTFGPAALGDQIAREFRI
jgi:hypothetical protein